MVCRSTTRKSLTIATPGTQRPKTDRRFHRPAPSGQKQTAVFTTFGSAVKNRPPFSPLLAQRSKTDRRFHSFWLSGQNITDFWRKSWPETAKRALFFLTAGHPRRKKWPDTQEENPIAYPANFPAPGWGLSRQPFNPIAYPATSPPPVGGLAGSPSIPSRTRQTSPPPVGGLTFFCFFSCVKTRKEDRQDKKRRSSRQEKKAPSREEKKAPRRSFIHLIVLPIKV